MKDVFCFLNELDFVDKLENDCYFLFDQIEISC